MPENHRLRASSDASSLGPTLLATYSLQRNPTQVRENLVDEDDSALLSRQDLLSTLRYSFLIVLLVALTDFLSKT